MTDLRIRLGLGSRAFVAPRNSLWRLIINLKFAKLWRVMTSQFTLKRAKMQTSSLHYQYANNAIIMFITQYKNYNIAVSCVVASFLSVENWTSNKEVLCQRFDNEEHGWARQRCRLSVWKWLQAVALRGQILWLKASNGISFGHCLSKHRMTRYMLEI